MGGSVKNGGHSVIDIDSVAPKVAWKKEAVGLEAPGDGFIHVDEVLCLVEWVNMTFGKGERNLEWIWCAALT